MAAKVLTLHQPWADQLARDVAMTSVYWDLPGHGR